jgi:hypothetical protein
MFLVIFSLAVLIKNYKLQTTNGACDIPYFRDYKTYSLLLTYFLCNAFLMNSPVPVNSYVL